MERAGIRRGTLAVRRTAQRRVGGILPERHPGGHAGRREQVGPIRGADGYRRRHPGGGRRCHVRDRVGSVGFLWANAAGAMAWLLMLIVSPTSRAAARVLTPGGAATFLRGAAHSIAAAGASAILVMGFPVLLKATSNQLGAQGGVIILAVTLTRAPLLIPLFGMQSNLIAHFVDKRTERLRTLIVPAVVVGGIGAVGVLAAGLLGPWLLRIGFGSGYHASGGLLAWLTAAAVAIAMLTLTGTAAVAAALHRAYSLGWVGATVASTLLLLLPLPLETRTVIALLCGPLVGIAVHLTALARSPGCGHY